MDRRKEKIVGYHEKEHIFHCYLLLLREKTANFITNDMEEICHKMSNIC